MQLVKAHIYGFGNWVDVTVDLSDEGFICLYGENEAGKSTLQEFLLFMLFGLPPKKRAFYQPKASSRMGGRLMITDHEYGSLTIERLDQVRNGAAICEMEDGNINDEDWLKERLNGLTAATYESIFSFSAMDLMEIRNMGEEDLGEVLLGIGLTGSASIQRIEKKLETSMGESFKPSGKNPVINKQLRLLDDQTKKIAQVKQKEAIYRDKKQQLGASAVTINTLQQQLKNINEKQRFSEKHLDVLPLLVTNDTYWRDLQDYPETVLFPEQGISRLERLTDQLLPLKGEYSALENNAAHFRKMLETLKHQAHDDEELKTARQLTDKQQTDSELKRQIRSLDERIDHLDDKIETELRRLDVGLEQKQLTRISFPFGIEKRWQKLKDRQEELTSETRRLDEEQRSLSYEQKELSREKQRITGQLLDETEATRLEQLLDRDTEENAQQKLMNHAHQQRVKWAHLKEKRDRGLGRILFTTIGVGLLITGSGLILPNRILALIGVLLMCFGAGQYLLGKQSLKNMTGLFEEKDMMTSYASLSETERAAMKSDLKQHNKAKDMLDAVEKAEQSNHLGWVKWEDTQRSLDVRKAQHAKQAEEETDSYPFLTAVDIAYWPELFLSVRNLVDHSNEKADLLQDLVHLKKERTTIWNETSAFYDHMKWSLHSEDTDVQKDLSEYLNEQQTIEHRINSYMTSLQDNQTELEQLTKKMNVYETERKQLFSKAGAADEDEFWKQAKRYEKKKQLESDLKDVLNQLSHRFSETDLDYLLTQATRDKDILQEYLDRTLGIQEETEQKLEQQRTIYSRLAAELEHMESEEEHSAMQYQFNVDKEELNRQAEKWAVLATVKGVLDKAKRTFREKYMDRIIEQTTTYFNALTNGRYTNVIGPDNQEYFRVEQNDGVRFDVNELSQGTVDQLYVSLRLAIGYMMSKEHQVPYLIDDAFVHFDEKRTRRVIKLLEEIAANQQIILLTCKKDIVQTVNKGKTVYLGESVRISAPLMIK